MKTISTAVFLAGMVGLPALVLAPAASAQVSVGVGVGSGGFGASLSIGMAPPPLLTYEQPMVPGPGYVWTPGYWAWSPAGYFYWVAGAWVLPPALGLLWTPGWWGWDNGLYNWYPGYWAPAVGFYGGINYGFGYFGVGYSGGYWLNRRFYYNTAVSRVNTVIIHNTYVDRTVIRHVKGDRISYNGGAGGVNARPSERDRAFEHQHRVGATQAQEVHRDRAERDPARRYDAGRGQPGAATGSSNIRPAPTDVGGRRSGTAQTETQGPRGVPPESRQTPAAGGARFDSPRQGAGPETMTNRGNGRPDGGQAMPDVRRGGRQQMQQPPASESRGGQPQPPRFESETRPQMQSPRFQPEARPQMQSPRFESQRRPQVQPPRFESAPRPQVQQPGPQARPQPQTQPQQPRFEQRARPQSRQEPRGGRQDTRRGRDTNDGR